MDEQASRAASWRHPRPLSAIGALIFLLAGAPLVWGGVQLLALGGSPYYVLAGVALLVTAVLLWRGHRGALWLYGALLVATSLWALAEVGLDCWGLLPRLAGPAILGLWFAIPAVRRQLVGGARWAGESLVTPALFVIAFALILGSCWQSRFEPLPGGRAAAAVAGDATEWTQYGGEQGGARFAPASLITPANVSGLERAWTYRTGDRIPPADPQRANLNFQVVPLKIGDGLYFCTPHNAVIALDADTGRQLWRATPKIDTRGNMHRVCRGLAYHAAAGDGMCAKRLLMGTLDDQLLAFDLRTGVPCPGFGTNGSVDLKAGLGDGPRGYHYVTSPPTIVRGVAVVGAFVFDNQMTDAPPGVIRGYDVTTGQLKWAWDVLQPTAAPPLKPGEHYPLGTPNVWTVASADEALGLVYLPTGNPSPDFFGGNRSPEMERYGSSIVALDATTGNVRWSFQTVHHDVWDYDIGSQPVLVDFNTPQGPVPALLAPTKRGEIFVLDRRTGKPLTRVVERPVPQGAVAGERTAPTQPFSVGFPSFAPPDLRETSMWGATPLDQLACRIAFHRHRYDGQFTPGATNGAIHYAGSFGVFDWGSLAIDKARRIAIVNASWFPYVDTLIPRRLADAGGILPIGVTGAQSNTPVQPTNKYSYISAQRGTPYAVDTAPFTSPLGFPCHQPPWGWIAGIDLDSRKVLWKRTFGTTGGSAPLGIALPTGIFNIGGAVATGGGVSFIGAAIDNYLRAYDTATGRELWKTALPAGGQASPISYVSKRTGRQYVVIAPGGHASLRTPIGDYVVAYALPRKH